MRSLVLALVAALLITAVARAAYDGVTGGTATPASIAVDGSTDYSVAITGKPKPVDIVIVVDASGSMTTNLSGGTSRIDAVVSATDDKIDALNGAGLFSRGGTIAIVSFSDTATTGAAPTTNVSTLKQALSNISPAGNGCLSCGIQRATDLLTAIPGAAMHKQITYVIGDGNDNVTPANVATATSASDAAHIERRAIGIPSGPIADLDSTDSGGAASYAGSVQDLDTAYAADPTSYSGATNLSWAFQLAPGFSASAPTASAGTATVTASGVTWTIPSLDATTATLTFHAVHDPAAGCAATSLLTGTTFSDSEGDAAPPAGLGPLTITGCPAQTATPTASPGPTPSPSAAPTITDVEAHGKTIGSRGGVSLSLVLDRAGKVKIQFKRQLLGRRVRGRCVAETSKNRSQPTCKRFTTAGTLTKTLKAGSHQVSLTKKVDGGHKLKPGKYHVIVGAVGAPAPAKTLTLKVRA